MTIRKLTSTSRSAGWLAMSVLLWQVACAGELSAQSYPAKPIRIISPFSAGSPPDAFGRLIAQQLTDKLGQSVLVENRPGGGTTIATKAASVADPDGYTLVQVNAALTYSPVLYPNAGYDPVKSFTPVALLATWTHVLVGNPSVEANSLTELIAYAKAHPGQLSIGFPLGSPPHVLSEMLKMATGADINSVPYRQGSQLVSDLLGGRLQLYFSAGEPIISMIRAGKLKAYAFTSERRDPVLPNVPTMAEAGLPELTVSPSDWTAILAPAGMRPDVVAKLNMAINEALQTPQSHAMLAKLGWHAKISTPHDVAEFVSTSAAKWPSIVKAAGLKAE